MRREIDAVSESLIKFPSDVEAYDFCKDNGISFRDISCDGEYYYVSYEAPRSSSEPVKVSKARVIKSTRYKGLESFTEAQLRKFEACHAIMWDNKRQRYWIDFEKVR